MSTTENSVAPASSVEYDDLRFYEEGQVIVNMILQNDLSAAKAVEQIVALCSQAAASQDEETLQNHVDGVTGTIHELSKRIRHDEQSKLIDFCVRLQQVTIADPKSGGVLELEDEEFWSDMPELSLTLADYKATEPGIGTQEENDREFENCTAWVAQLSEIGFSFYKEDISWNFYPLTRILQDNFRVKRHDVRLVCIWFIYAPKKVWSDVQLRRHLEGRSENNELLPEFWPAWKQFLQNCQSTPSEALGDVDTQELSNRQSRDFLDEDTQELIRRALNSMEMTEVAGIP